MEAISLSRIICHLLTFTAGISFTLNGQILNSTGGNIHISGGAMNVQGKMLMDSASVIENKAVLKIDTLKNEGDIKLTGNAAQLVIDSGAILRKGILKISEGKLLLLNNDTAALQVDSNAGIKIENSIRGEVVWHIGEIEAGKKYRIPFVNDSLEDVGIELEVVEGGTGNGYIEFISYSTETNNMHYPPEMYEYYFKNSDEIVNRFWGVSAVNYSIAPIATIAFKYADSDTIGMNEAPAIVSKWLDTSWVPLNASVNISENKFTLDSLSDYSIWALSSDTIQTQKAFFHCEGYEEDTIPEDLQRRSCGGSSHTFNAKYRLQTSFYPDISTPLKYINVAFIVRHKSDSTENYLPSNPAHVQFLNDIEARMNYFLSNNEPPSDPRTAVCGTCYIKDSRMRVRVVQTVHTYDDATYGDTTTVNAVNRNNTINVFLYGDLPGCPAAGGQAGGGTIWMANQLCNNKPVDEVAQNILHEIFHVFGVDHVYADGSCNIVCCDSCAQKNCTTCTICAACPTNCSTCCKRNRWFGDDVSDTTNIDYLTDVFGDNTGEHAWESYIYNSCDTTASCDPRSNLNDNCTNNFMGTSATSTHIGRV